MLGIRYIKANPNTYLIQYKNGKPVREGTGLAFFYFAPSSSLVSVPMQSADVPFMFREVSSDFQEVSIQGQVTYRVAEAKTLAAMLNFSLKPDGVTYFSEDPAKLPGRVLNAAQVQISTEIRKLGLEEILRAGEQLARSVREGLASTSGLNELGISITDLSILAVKPTPETSRALEAKVRETLLKQADDAIYTRRNAAIEQERAVKENELRTEIAIEQKKREIKETQLEAERAVLEKRQQIQRQDMDGKIKLEESNKQLVELAGENARAEADVRAYALAGTMKAVAGTDARVLQALALGGGGDPATLISLAFQGLADNAAKIGELNISPELLQQLIARKK